MSKMSKKIKAFYKENKKSTLIVYVILRVLVIVCMIGEILRKNWDNVFLCVLTLVLFIIPYIVDRKLKIKLPDTLEIIILLFIFSAEILGEIQNFYGIFSQWDTMLHTLNGFLCAAIGFSLIDILNRDEKVEELKLEIIRLEKTLKNKADELTKARKEVALRLEEVLLVELKSLNMKNVVFKVNFEETVFNMKGQDDIEFMISFNLGEDIKPIYKVASGGEMSRFMLAFKTILADIDQIDTLVFDEIDTGISGIAAQIVGEKLSNIGKKKQIICITHLPQIAATADTHYCIEKSTSNERTFTTIRRLDNNQRKDEIARLIAGSNITEKTMEHATEIIELAKRSL